MVNWASKFGSSGVRCLAKKIFLRTRSRRNLLADQGVSVVRVAKAVANVVTVAAVAVVKEEILPAVTAKTTPDLVVAAVATGAAKDNCKLISKEIKDVTAEKDRI